MNPPDLMEAARALSESGRAPPTQARLRRAVSTAYYAMFHTFQKSDVLWHIVSAERAISRFEQADVAARRSFAAHVLFRQRPS